MMNMTAGSHLPQPPVPAPLEGHGTTRLRPEDAATHITVSDPVQHSDGLKSYTSYRVDVRPAAGEAPPSAVLRRYSDFYWLYERLHTERAGAIVPPVPEKQPVGRFSPAFVADRRRHLERFLRRVAVHPELADAPSLETFLRADDVSFQVAKSAKGTIVVDNSLPGFPQPLMNVPSPKKDGLKRWFAEAKTSMTGDLVRSPDDDLFEEIHRYVHGLDAQMRAVAQQAGGLVRKGREAANGMFEFGLAFNLLGQSEADALGDALRRMGAAADELSVLGAEHAEREATRFEEPLQDYMRTIHAVKLALQRRHEKRLTCSTAVADVEAKQLQLAKLRMQIGSEAKAYQTEMALRRAQDAEALAREEFAVVSQRVLREVDRFRREKAEDMRRTVLDYINLQVEYNKRMEQVWAALLPQLESVQVEGNGPPYAPAPAMAAPAVSPQRSGLVGQVQEPGTPQYAPLPGPMPPQPPTPTYENHVPAPMDASGLSIQYRDVPTGF